MTNPEQDVSSAVTREAGKLAAFIKARVRDTADAEDILQDVLFEFLQACRLPEPIEHAGAWLFRVARNRIIDRFRKNARRPAGDLIANREAEDGPDYLNLELPSPDAGPEGEFTRLAILDALQQALDELPASQREVFIAHEIHGQSFESLARREGIPVNTLLSRKRYAVLYLRQRLQKLYDDLD